MNLLVIGYKGKLGRKLVERGATPLDCDVTDIISVEIALRQYVDSHQPYTVIFAAGKTNVEWCEDHQKEAYNVNVLGLNNVMMVMSKGVRSRSKLINLSSCHVFSGNQRIVHFAYSERHKGDPVNYYGFTKYASEGIPSIWQNFPAFSVRIGKAYDDTDIINIRAIEEEIPTFIHRNFIYIDDVCDIIERLCYVHAAKIPFHHFVRVLHIGHPGQNYPYRTFYNLVREEYALDPLPARRNPLPDMVDRPFWCELNVRKMESLIGDKKFRNL